MSEYLHYLYIYTHTHTLHVCECTPYPYTHHIIGTLEVFIQKNQPKAAPQTHRALPRSICCLLPKFLPEEWMKSKSCPMLWMKLWLFIRSLFSGNNLLATRMLCYTTSSFFAWEFTVHTLHQHINPVYFSIYSPGTKWIKSFFYYYCFFSVKETITAFPTSTTTRRQIRGGCGRAVAFYSKLLFSLGLMAIFSFFLFFFPFSLILPLMTLLINRD